jgi:putative sporulation protein YyaC
MRRRFLTLLSQQAHRPHVLLCLGSDRSTGDSLGPLTGTKIAMYSPSNISIFGTLDNPVHARNLKETLLVIKELYPNPFIIALDATLGHRQSVGYLTLSFGPLHPGKALKKRLPPVGDVHLTGVVNVNRLIQSFVLQNTPLDLVWRMSDFFCDLFSSIPYYKIFKP